ncbi:MAG: hypothetical protein DRQ55_16550 [Planctomycetota bacterium]|nr:MAG: hypothetical protein DRQ55_16550 [Planctomycetota bacterium]RKZ10268.1 MAG: hypothetical protein DRQ32_07375 [bacterium]
MPAPNLRDLGVVNGPAFPFRVAEDATERVNQAARRLGLDGIFSALGDCSCAAPHLFPCGAPWPDCELGRKRRGCSSECEAGGCDHHIVPSAKRARWDAHGWDANGSPAGGLMDHKARTP